MEDAGLGVVSQGLNSDPISNCAMLSASCGGWLNFPCQIGATTPISCGCERPGQMYLQLRGLCADSNIDRFYIPRNKNGSGAVILLGFYTTIIEYDIENVSWTLREYSQNTTAVTDAPFTSFALGANEWFIEGDSFDCSRKGMPYKRMLKLTGCREGEFTCRDGQCIR